MLPKLTEFPFAPVRYEEGLRQVEYNVNSAGPASVARWIDLKAQGIGSYRAVDDLWAILVKELKSAGVLDDKVRGQISPDALLEKIFQWIQTNPNRRLLLLLDEADTFLESDGKTTSAHPEPFARCARLKGLMDKTNRRFKVVFAGLHNVQRTTRVANNPLAHYGDPICIGPLLQNGEARAAQELIEVPLASIGYFFEAPDLVIRILAHTNYYPSLIQVFCTYLLRHVLEHNAGLFDPRKVPPYVITAQQVEEAYNRQDFRKAIRDRFIWTLDLDKRYRLIAFVLAFQHRNSADGMEVPAIRQSALAFWPKGFEQSSAEETFRGVLDEMVGLGILRRVTEKDRYALRSPNIVSLLGTQQEVDDELLAADTWEPPIQYEAEVFRRALHQTDLSNRSPLTAAQEGKLQLAGNRVFIVCGCEMSGLTEAPGAMGRCSARTHSS